MKSIAISGSRRENVGKKHSKALRDNGDVPCVLYGGKEQTHFFAPSPAFKHLVYTAEIFTVDLTIDGTAHQAILKDIQFHPVTDKILHIDFLELADNKPVAIGVPIRVVGNSVGVRAGGKLIKKIRKLTIKALPKHLPDDVEINIDTLDIGKDIRVSDIKLNGVEILDSPNNVIVTVQTTRASIQAADTAKK